MIAVSPATPADATAIADLMEELDRFYGATEVAPRDARARQIEGLLFRDPPVAHVLLAHDGADLVGLASYSFLWPAAGVTASLYLKELYVRQTRQREGIGRLLMQELCGIALKAGCSRVEWTTEIDNTRARQFYEALGAPINTDKLSYRLEGSGLDTLARQASQ